MSDFSKLTWQRQLRGADISNAAYRVLMTLFDYSDGNGRNAHPGLGRLVSDTTLSQSTVQRALRDLLQHGWIERTSASDGRRGEADSYRLTTPEPVVMGDQWSSKPVVMGDHQFGEPVVMGDHQFGEPVVISSRPVVMGDHPSEPYTSDPQTSDQRRSDQTGVSAPLRSAQDTPPPSEDSMAPSGDGKDWIPPWEDQEVFDALIAAETPESFDLLATEALGPVPAPSSAAAAAGAGPEPAVANSSGGRWFVRHCTGQWRVEQPFTDPAIEMECLDCSTPLLVTKAEPPSVSRSRPPRPEVHNYDPSVDPSRWH